MVKQFEKNGLGHTVDKLPGPRTFDVAANLPDGNPASLTCSKIVTVDTKLHIRHGTALTLRGVRWLVTDQAVGDPLLGRPVLEALGLNTRNILAAAAEKHSGEVSVSALFSSETSSCGEVSRILEGVLLADGRGDDADLDDDDGWLDMGPESSSEKKSVLDGKVKEASDNGMSNEGIKVLRNLLCAFDDVVKLKLDSTKPADIEPMRVNLKPG